MKSVIDRPFHPLLFAAYPVLALLAWNLGELQPVAGLRSLAISLLLAGALWWGLGRLLHDAHKAAILTSLVAVLFFSYGHVYQVTEGVSLAGVVVGRHRLLLVVWAAALVGASAWMVRRQAIPQGLTRFLNITVALALIVPLLQIGSYQVKALAKGSQANAAPASPIALVPPAGQPLPDVYYIILDAYTRQDVLERVFSYDNQPFIQGLRDLGFRGHRPEPEQLCHHPPFHPIITQHKLSGHAGSFAGSQRQGRCLARPHLQEQRRPPGLGQAWATRLWPSKAPTG